MVKMLKFRDMKGYEEDMKRICKGRLGVFLRLLSISYPLISLHILFISPSYFLSLEG